MKDLKVKAWDTIDNRWYTGTSEFLWLDSKIFELKQDELIFCVYTGLRDINNIEIYEGDILKTTGLYQVNFIVEYSDRSFELFDGKDGIVSDEHNDWSEYKVIGNIYENPKLCKILK